MKFIDISHRLNGDTPVYPGDYNTSITKYKDMETDFYNSYLLQSCLHTGTHIDMPMHMINDKNSAADFNIDCFIGDGVLIDARGEAIISMKAAYEKIIGVGSVVLIYTGFDEMYFEPEYFCRYPIIDVNFAEFLISRKVKMLGTDTPAPDYPPFTIHKRLLSSNIFILENLTNLKALSNTEKFEVIALPLKIDAEASFVRAICRVY